MADFNELMKIAGDDARHNGWWTDFPEKALGIMEIREGHTLTPEQHAWIGNKLMLMVSEIAEAHDEIRNHHALHEIYQNGNDPKPEGFPTELADVVIRIMDLCHNLGIDLENAINVKLAYNRTRGFKHGGKAS